MNKEGNRGLSVQVNNEEEFNTIKAFLGESDLYLGWVPQMGTTPTAVVIHYGDETVFSRGSVGSAEYQESFGMRVVDFNQYFKTTTDEKI